MLLVKTYIGPSKIHGIGLFAGEFIAKGTPIWKFQREFDRTITKEHLDTLPVITQKFIIKYAYLSKKTNNYILCADDARFQNHSNTPNCIDQTAEGEKEGVDIAATDIQQGEELTMDYSTFDSDTINKLSNS